jgi:hypothetical protein
MQFQPPGRELPPVDSVIQRATPRPRISLGQDARVVAAEALQYGDENAGKVEAGRANYGRVVSTFSGRN